MFPFLGNIDCDKTGKFSLVTVGCDKTGKFSLVTLSFSRDAFVPDDNYSI